MLLLTKVKQFSNLLKIKKEIGVGYSFSCDFPIRHACGCPESKIMSLKYPHLQLLIRNCQFYMLSVSLGANPPWQTNEPANSNMFFMFNNNIYAEFRTAYKHLNF